MTLQEYALRHMMAEKCFDRIVIGASTMQDLQHQTKLMDAIDSGEHPLDEISSAGESEKTENEKGDSDKDKIK